MTNSVKLPEQPIGQSTLNRARVSACARRAQHAGKAGDAL